MISDLAYELRAVNTASSDPADYPIFTGSMNDGTAFKFVIGTNCGTNGACSINGNTKEYDGRWYYSWYAATAEKATSSTNSDVDGSICPTGWKLPYNYSYQADRSYGGLLESYGISAANHSTTTEQEVLDALPLSFVRAGYLNSGSIVFASHGGFWSSTPNSSYAYGLYYGYGSGSFVDPQRSDISRYFGISVRCVAL